MQSRLYDALDAVEADDDKGKVMLASWHQEALRGNSEVILVEDEIDSHKGRSINNLGSPLYVAVVRDQPKAAQALLELGDDPNYAHPEHGDGPLLHAAESGYGECLEVLLSDKRCDLLSVESIDRKIFLGQGLPQYTEGGLSALQLAATKGHVSTVKKILSHGLELLDKKDSFGRSVLQATLDAYAMVTPDRVKVRSRLAEVVALLCEALGRSDVQEILEKEVPTLEAAREGERLRNRQLRTRCLKASAEKQAKVREEGLKNIAQYYRPLHNSLPLQEAPSKRIEEPFPGVFSFNLLAAESCQNFWEEVHHYEAAATQHVDPSRHLPLQIRHDGNLGNLQDCGFEPFLKSLEDMFRPILRECMPDVTDFSIYHAFLTRNYVGREQNATFKIHQDKSDLTFNLCVHASDDFQGSTVGFYESPGPGETPSPADRRYTYGHEVGKAAVHSGLIWHKTDAITAGTRGSLIAWARLGKDIPRPSVGDFVRLGENPRNSDGVLSNGAIGILVEDDGVSKQPFQVSNLDGSQYSYYHSADIITVEAEHSEAPLGTSTTIAD